MKKNRRKKKQTQQKKKRQLLKNHTNVGKQYEKHQLTQKCWKTQTAVKNNRTKRRNRRTQQTQSRRPPDNDKMTDKRSKPTKPRTKRANSGIKETYHRKTSRQATKQPEAHANAQNRQQTIFPGRKSARAAQTAPTGKNK